MAKGKKTGGRQKGTPNKTSKALKDMILGALEQAGGKGGGIAYLKKQADENPKDFLALLAKVLPMQITGDDGGPIEHKYTMSREVEEKLNEVLDPQAGE